MHHPNVRLPPPMIFVACLSASWLLHALGMGLPLAEGVVAQRGLRWAGWALMTPGSLITAWAILIFARVRTPIMPMHPASRLVTWGPYRWSRNPMYVGVFIIYVSLALVYNSAWPLLFLPVAWVLIQWVISREERALLRVFGEEYARYMQQVPRWL